MSKASISWSGPLAGKHVPLSRKRQAVKLDSACAAWRIRDKSWPSMGKYAFAVAFANDVKYNILYGIIPKSACCRFTA